MPAGRTSLRLSIYLSAHLLMAGQLMALYLGQTISMGVFSENPQPGMKTYPALAAYYEHPALLIGHSFSETHPRNLLSLSLPISIGSLALDYESIDLAGGQEQLPQTSIAKRFTPNLALALSAGASLYTTAYYAGPSLVYRNDSPAWNNNPIGLHAVTIAASLFGYSAAPPTSPNQSNMEANTSLDFTIYNYGITRLHLIHHSRLYYNTATTQVQLDNSLMAGFGYASLFLAAGTASFNENRIAISLGVGREIQEMKFSLQYTITGKGSESSINHYISAGGNFSVEDTKPPLVTLQPDTTAISPNGDGIQDEVIFSIKVKEANPIADWRFEIYNSKGEPVRSLEKDLRKKRVEYPLSRVPQDIANRVENLYIPKTIIWDGSYNPIDPGDTKTTPPGRIVPDGVYTYTFVVQDMAGNRSEAVSGEITVDSLRPQISVEAASSLLVFDDTPAIPQFTIYQSIDNEERSDTVEVSIFGEDDRLIREFSQTAKATPTRYKWEVMTKQGERLEPGLYRYEARISDIAGNQSSSSTQWVSFYPPGRVADIEIKARGFSPNGDGKFDTILFDPYLSSRSRIDDWRLIVYRQTKEENEIEIIQTWEPENPDKVSPPGPIEWDGETNYETRLTDGPYYAVLEAAYSTGENITSYPKPFLVDTTPPRIKVEHALDQFSPDGDGNYEENYFKIRLTDMSEIESCKLQVDENFEHQKMAASREYRKWESAGKCAQKIRWDGVDNQGNLPEGDSRFTYTVEAVDEFGNSSAGKRGQIQTDFLVQNKQDFLLIRLSTASYEKGAVEPSRQTMRKVDRVIRKIKKYPHYLVRIEGHTSARGDEEKNLSLSEERARYITNYFLQNGFSESEVGFQGMGEIRTVWEDNDDYSSSVNERLDFVLIEKD